MENTLAPNQISSTQSQPTPDLCPTSATLIALPSLYTLLFLTGLPGNALSLWVFLRRISEDAPTQVYLSHLSASNLLVSLTTPFMVIYYVQASTQPADSALCQLVLHGATPVLHINVQLSVVLLTWVALSRLAVVRRRMSGGRGGGGFFRRLRKASFARGVCTAAWVVVVVPTTCVTLYYSVKETGSGRSWTPDRGEMVNDTNASSNTGKEEVVLCYSAATELGGFLSRAGQVTTITLFFACFLLVLLCYVLLLVHVRRSRRNIKMAASKSLLRKVFRNIVVIKMVLIFCLVPHNVFKAVFISSVRDDGGSLHPYSSGPEAERCHPLSSLIEIKNLLFLLAILRGSLDPVMYFLLDRAFRQQTLLLLGCGPQTTGPKEAGSAQLPGQSQPGTDTATADLTSL